jgi:hypothetical protein
MPLAYRGLNHCTNPWTPFLQTRSRKRNRAWRFRRCRHRKGAVRGRLLGCRSTRRGKSPARCSHAAPRTRTSAGPISGSATRRPATPRPSCTSRTILMRGSGSRMHHRFVSAGAAFLHNPRELSTMIKSPARKRLRRKRLRIASFPPEWNEIITRNLRITDVACCDVARDDFCMQKITPFELAIAQSLVRSPAALRSSRHGAHVTSSLVQHRGVAIAGCGVRNCERPPFIDSWFPGF